MSVHLLITAGRGPGECQLVVRRLAAILTTEATSAGLTVTAGPTVAGSGEGGARSIVLVVTGEGAPAWAASVNGPVRWIATSPIRPRHPRRNWFVQVAVLGADDTDDVARFDEGDVIFHPIRSGGPGGQRRNKVATAVRAVHTPSGRIVVASGERTLTANKAAALARLSALATVRQDDQQRQRDQHRWKRHDQVIRGNPVRTVRAPLT